MDRRNRHVLKCGTALVAMLAVGAGCSDSSVREYEVPKGSEHIVAGNPSSVADQLPEREAAAAPVSEAGWVVPANWRELDESRPMRITTFVIEDEAGPVEVAVTRFPGHTGGMLANVNRWRGQIGLDPAAEADLDALLTPFTTPRFEGHLLHLEGPARDMVVASIYEPAADRTWFVRVTAEQAIAGRVKPEVFAFARSFGTADAPERQ